MVRNKYLLSDTLWERFSDRFHHIQVVAKEVLLEEGAVAQKMFFIEKGCVRGWYNKDGKEITIQFFFENDSVSSIESFRKEIPSRITLETLEPTTLRWLYKKDFCKIIEEIKDDHPLLDRFIDAIFERTYTYIDHFFSFLKDTPEERYLKLLEEKPQIIQRVPQHYIASYLGISKVHLSRIKSKIARNKEGFH